MNRNRIKKYDAIRGEDSVLTLETFYDGSAAWAGLLQEVMVEVRTSPLELTPYVMGTYTIDPEDPKRIQVKILWETVRWNLGSGLYIKVYGKDPTAGGLKKVIAEAEIWYKDF